MNNVYANAGNKIDGKGIVVSGRGRNMVITGYNDLQTMFPEIAKEFDEEKSGIKASEIGGKSKEYVWFTCPHGHSYRIRLAHRTCDNEGCYYCSGKKILPGFNDLATTHPLVAAQMDEEKTGKKTIEVSKGMVLKAWWTCPNGHSYQKRICDRIRVRGDKETISGCTCCRQ